MATFHQPFTTLPVSCGAVERQVRQVRLCVEVLRRYLGVEPPTCDQQSAFQQQYKRYLLETYTTLLTQIGASYEALRLARTATPEERRALANRLGMDLGATQPDHLDALFLDPETITEARLETLFGLADTTKADPLADNPIPPALQTWRLEHLRTLWKTQDWPTDPYAKGQLPLIDPDVISLADLRHPVPHDKAYDFWMSRRHSLDLLLADLKAKRETQGLTAILKQILGDPLPDLTSLNNRLTQGIDSEATQRAITQRLHLTVESFTRLMALKAKAEDADPAAQPTAEEWGEVYAILTQAEKAKHFVSLRTEEEIAGVVLGPEHFWIALEEPELRLWLATTVTRQQWQQALRRNSQAPALNPDLLNEDDFKDPTAGDPAFDLWQTRKDWIAAQLSALQAAREAEASDLAGLDAILASTLGAPATELATLAEARKTGQNIAARLEQLTLSNEAFGYLLRIRELAVRAAPILGSEWSAVYSILAQVKKRRAFAAWQREERNQGILLGPDHFQIPAPSALQFPPPEPAPLPDWRATWNARRDWQDTLQSRLDQDRAVIEGLQAVVSAAEAATLPQLRDALIMATNAAGADLATKAEWLNHRLLIDMKTGSCMLTTRIAQAIETLQALFFELRTGQFNQNYLHEWFPLSSNLTVPLRSVVSAVSRKANHLDLFVVGAEGGVYTTFGNPQDGWETGRAWSRIGASVDFKAMPGSVVSAVARPAYPEQLDLFVVGPEGGVYGTWWNPRDGWEHDGYRLGAASDFKVPAGSVVSAVSCNPNRLDLFVVGSDGGVYGIFWTAGNNWQQNWARLGAAIDFKVPPRSVVSAVCRQPDQIDLFVVGSDGGVYSTWWNPRESWESNHNWFRIGVAVDFKVPPGSVVSAVARKPERLDLFVVTAEGGVYSTWWNPQEHWESNHTWFRIGVGIDFKVPPGSMVSTVARNQNQLDLFVVGADGGVYTTWWNPEDGWESYQTWFRIGNTSVPRMSVVTAVTPAAEHIDLFVITRDGQVSASWWDGQWHVSELTLLDPNQFDADWQWLGSYATWRAAMFVFLYPENMLHPSLRKKSTPAFQALVKKLSVNRHLTPEQACALAAEYASYYEDVAKLILDATCQATAVVQSGSKCVPGSLSIKMLVFIFGRGGLSNRAYWSTFDPDDQTGYAQSYWDEIPGIGRIRQVVGAVPYAMSPTSRRIFLFIRTVDHKLQFATFDLETWNWSELADLGLPPGGPSQIEIVIHQNNDNLPPAFAITSNDNIYFRNLNTNGTDWEAGDWEGFKLDKQRLNMLNVFKLHASLEQYLILQIGDVTHRSRFNKITDQEIKPSEYIGAVTWGIAGTAGWYVRKILSDGTVVAEKPTGIHPPTILDQFPTQNLKKIVPNCGVGKYVIFAYERSGPIPIIAEPDGLYLRFDWLHDLSDPDQTIRTQRRRIAPPVLPIVRDQFSIPSRLDAQALKVRQANNRLLLLETSDSATNRTYVEEARYFVPILIAGALQRSGEYITALDWFRTVYDYTAPEDSRKIYYGLVLEESLGEILRRNPDWLRDPLHPHAIAATRRNTYTRFTLLAIIRCLLDYADAEFTRDTAESVPRARQLYLTALELLNTTVLEQQPGPLEETVANLSALGIPDSQASRMRALRSDIDTIPDAARRREVADLTKRMLTRGESWPGRFANAREIVRQALAESSTLTLAAALQQEERFKRSLRQAMLANPTLAEAVQKIGPVAEEDSLRTVPMATAAPTQESEQPLAPIPRTIPPEVIAVQSMTVPSIASETPLRFCPIPCAFPRLRSAESSSQRIAPPCGTESVQTTHLSQHCGYATATGTLRRADRYDKRFADARRRRANYPAGNGNFAPYALSFCRPYRADETARTTGLTIRGRHAVRSGETG